MAQSTEVEPKSLAGGFFTEPFMLNELTLYVRSWIGRRSSRQESELHAFQLGSARQYVLAQRRCCRKSCRTFSLHECITFARSPHTIRNPGLPSSRLCPGRFCRGLRRIRGRECIWRVCSRADSRRANAEARRYPRVEAGHSVRRRESSTDGRHRSYRCFRSN